MTKKQVKKNAEKFGIDAKYSGKKRRFYFIIIDYKKLEDELKKRKL